MLIKSLARRVCSSSGEGRRVRREAKKPPQRRHEREACGRGPWAAVAGHAVGACYVFFSQEREETEAGRRGKVQQGK